MFQVFAKTLKKHEIYEEDLKKFNSFMFCRWLSGNSKTIKIANMINYYYDIPDLNQLNLVKDSVQEKFIKFPSFKLEKQDVRHIQDRYNISYEKALDYLDIVNTINK